MKIIEWHCMQLELNSIEFNSYSTKFNSTTGLRLDWIQFKFNWKEMRWILVEKVLKLFVNMVLKEKTSNKNLSPKRQVLRNGINKFQFKIVQVTTYGT